MTDHIDRVIAWIRFPGLPLEYFKVLALSRMATHANRVIKLHRYTEEAIHGQYARVCVELDLNRSLDSKIRVGKLLQRIEYECFHLICFSCSKVGHKKDFCPSNVSAPTDVSVVYDASSPKSCSTENDGEAFGP
ncbi:hypothetical protein REPUB_Repub04eG0125100 [Reevesia pubescens]